MPNPVKECPYCRPILHPPGISGRSGSSNSGVAVGPGVGVAPGVGVGVDAGMGVRVGTAVSVGSGVGVGVGVRVGGGVGVGVTVGKTTSRMGMGISPLSASGSFWNSSTSMGSRNKGSSGAVRALCFFVGL